MQSAELDRLASRVRVAARDGGLIETAQVKLIGLDEVRAAAGPRWPRMREYVREGSVKIIASRIGPDDAVVSCGDGFLVVFADAASEHTERRCAELRDALLSFYLGEDALKALRADVRRETTSAANLAGLVANEASPTRDTPQRNDLYLGRFWPVWSARRQGIAAYHCAPAIEAPRAPIRMGYTADFLDKPDHRDCDFLDLDLCLLEQACEAAERPGAGPIGVSVHSTTMQNRRLRTLYLEHVAANPAATQSRMFVTISEVAPGTPLISLTEWTNALKSRFLRIALDLHHSDRAIAPIASMGVWAAGYYLPCGPRSSGAQLRAALTQLELWSQVLQRQGVQPFVNGFCDAGFFDLASTTHLAFATGESLWPSDKQPPT